MLLETEWLRFVYYDAFTHTLRFLCKLSHFEGTSLYDHFVHDNEYC